MGCTSRLDGLAWVAIIPLLYIFHSDGLLVNGASKHPIQADFLKES